MWALLVVDKHIDAAAMLAQALFEASLGAQGWQEVHCCCMGVPLAQAPGLGLEQSAVPLLLLLWYCLQAAEVLAAAQVKVVEAGRAAEMLAVQCILFEQQVCEVLAAMAAALTRHQPPVGACCAGTLAGLAISQGRQVFTCKPCSSWSKPRLHSWQGDAATATVGMLQ